MEKFHIESIFSLPTGDLCVHDWIGESWFLVRNEFLDQSGMYAARSRCIANGKQFQLISDKKTYIQSHRQCSRRFNYVSLRRKCFVTSSKLRNTHIEPLISLSFRHPCQKGIIRCRCIGMYSKRSLSRVRIVESRMIRKNSILGWAETLRRAIGCRSLCPDDMADIMAETQSGAKWCQLNDSQNSLAIVDIVDGDDYVCLYH